jgi:hypothetical protein
METERNGILGALERMGELEEARQSDKYARKIVDDIIEAMTKKDRQKWPDKELRSIVNRMDKVQKRLFLETLLDIKRGFEEHYGE